MMNYIKQGDCLELMKGLPDGAVDLTVTSPPYDNLRTYNGNIDQWNFEKFKAIAEELYRVTADGGVVVWVVADATIKGSETGTSFRQALWFMACGFRLHDTMIFAKSNPIPQTHNRYEQAFEYMFVFSKGKPKTFNPLLEKTAMAGAKLNRGTASKFDALQSMRRRAETTTVKPYKRKTNIFVYTVGGGRTGHPAVFPEALANDHIVTWSKEGDTILDPFMGSGTTGKMALLNNRNFVGFELDPEYFEIAQNRIQDVVAV